MFWIWRKIFKPALEFVGNIEAFHTIQSFLWPSLMSLSAVVSGYIGGAPIMWIIMAAVLTFMGATVAILAISIDAERRNPLNKLLFTTSFQCDLSPAQVPLGNRAQRRGQRAQIGTQTLSSTQINTEVIRTIDKGQLGVEVLNTATFTISCILESAKTSIEGFEPPRSDFPKPPVQIHPGMRVKMCDDAIEMDKFPSGNLAGVINMTIKYGKPGKEKLEMKIDSKVSIRMESYGLVSHVVTDLTKAVDAA